MPEGVLEEQIPFEQAPCQAEACPGYQSPVNWYSRKKILSQLSLSQVRPSWTGYWFHYRCFVRWRESWRK